jgi:PAS domain S-box-containing protein
MESRRTDVPFEAMLASLPDPVLLFEPLRDEEGRVVDFRIAYRNPAAAQVSGVPDDQLVGHRLLEAVRRRDDADPVTRFAEVLATGEPSIQEAERIDLEIAGQGRLEGIYESCAIKVGDAVMLTYRDVTGAAMARRELEAREVRYREAVDALDAGVIVVDADGCVQAANSAAERIFEVEPGALVGHRIGNPTHPVVGEDGTELPAADYPIAITLRTGEPVVGRVLGVRSRGGQRSWLLANTAPLIDSGEVIGAVSSFTDISGLKRAEEELRHTNEQLEQFAAAASHDLTEPARIVRGFAELLQKSHGDALAGDARDFLTHIVNASARMESMVRALADYARAGRAAAARQPVETAQIARETVEVFRPTIDGKEARVEIGDLPAVHADPGALAHVFQNLIGNALKFTADHPPVVQVSAEREDEAWRITVSDNGIGIDPARTEEIFGLFRRLHPSDQFPGTGIGLALARELVQRDGGRIWAEARLEGGTAVHFTVPDQG